jgi:hypothetical protein
MKVVKSKGLAQRLKIAISKYAKAYSAVNWNARVRILKIDTGGTPPMTGEVLRAHLEEVRRKLFDEIDRVVGLLPEEER